MSKTFKVKRIINGEYAEVYGCGGYDDVRFEGYLCSATADKKTGRVEYFTIGRDGHARDSFKLNKMGLAGNSALSFQLKNKKNKLINVDKASDNIIEVVRYFRCWNFDLDQISNLGGLTVICELNFDTMTMCVYPAFCSDEDNFDKNVGLMIASDRQQLGHGITMPFDHKISIRKNLYRSLLNGRWDYISNDQELNEMMNLGFGRCMNESNDGLLSPILENY